MRKCWGWEVQIQKITLVIIYIPFVSLLTKKWPVRYKLLQRPWKSCTVICMLDATFGKLCLTCRVLFSSVMACIDCMFLSCHIHISEWITVWLDGWVFVYKLSGCGFKSGCMAWISNRDLLTSEVITLIKKLTDLNWCLTDPTNQCLNDV